MIKKLNNQGSTLLSALMIVTLLMVLGLSLTAVTLSHAAQTDRQLNDLQAINTSEMGLKAYNQKIDEVTTALQSGNSDNSVDEIKKKLESAIPDTLSLYFDTLSSTPSFKVDRKILTNNNQEFTWEITSKGTAGTSSHTIVAKHTFTFTSTGGGSQTTIPFKGVAPPYVDAALYTFNNDLFPFHDGFDEGMPNSYHSSSKKWGEIFGNAIINGGILTGDPNKLDMAAIKAQFEADNAHYPLDKETTFLLYGNHPNNLVVTGSFFHSVVMNDQASFEGNLLVIGNLNIETKNRKDIVFPGYVYVTGNLVIWGNGNVTFKHTVYTGKNTYFAFIHQKATFEDGLVTNNAYGATLPKGSVIINSEHRAPASTSFTSSDGPVEYK